MANGQKPAMMPMINFSQGVTKAPVSTPVLSQLQQRVAQAQLQGITEQRQGLADTKARLEALRAQPKQKDLTALAALADMFGGTNLTQLYQHMKPKDQTKEIQNLEKLLTQQRMGLADDELNFLKAQFQSVKDSQKMKLDLTPGQKKLDQEFAKEYADFFAGGGYADVEKGLSQLDDALVSLESSDDITGPVIGSVPNALRRRFSPQSAAVQQDVEEVVQRNLRLVLGAQFTENEGKRLIERAYDPAADEAVNAKRLKRLITQIREAAQAKQDSADYFEEHGTLKGYKGSQKYKSANDFLKDEKPKKKATSSGPKVGTIVDGYKFKGGNPADKSNWEQQ